MPSRLDDMLVFARVIEAGNLTEAARQLGSTRSAVSKAVARLEKHLATRLLHRTTRELSATAAGHACYAHAARIAAELDATERTASELRDAPHGKLRVSCSGSLGLMLAPAIPKFCTTYPAVALELRLSEDVVDLVRDGVDVGIRLGKLEDSTLVARKLASYRRVICASPAYLADHGTPRAPKELAKHTCVLRIGHDQWKLGREAVRVHGNYFADTPELVRHAALAGLGLVLLPSFVVETDLAAGRLVEVLAAQMTEQFAIYAVYPNQRYLAPNVRAFIDFLVDLLLVGRVRPQ
jgi:DNA-binding transcriptional LysR family regulator